MNEQPQTIQTQTQSDLTPESTSKRRSRGDALWTVMRFIIAFILLYAAFEKAKQLGRGTLPVSNSLLDSPLVNFFAVLFESAFAVWTLAGLAAVITRGAAFTLFAAFAGISLSKALTGAESCGCFGAREVNPYITFAMDAVIAATTLVSLIFRDKSKSVREELKIERKTKLVLLCCALAAGVYGAIVFTTDPNGNENILTSVDQDFTPGSTIVLEPDRWLDEYCPLLEYCSQKERLSKGRWFVMLHRVDCKTCQATFPTILKDAQARGVPLAMIDVDASDEQKTDEGVELYDKLAPQYAWFVETPRVFVINDGVVSEILARK